MESSMAKGLLSRPANVPARMSVWRLTPREIEILRLIANGRRDREIADSLYLSHHTVANHVRNILGKLEAQSRAAAITRAMREGLL